MLNEDLTLPIKILVVDDEEDALDAIEQTFIEETLNNEYELVYAQNGQEVWSKIQDETPDLILLDLKMPKGDGFTLLHRLTENNIYIKTIVISAHETMSNVKRSLKERTFNFLAKPFDPEELKETVKDVLVFDEGKFIKTNLTTVSRLANKLSEAQKYKLVLELVEDFKAKHLEVLQKNLPSLADVARKEREIERQIMLKDQERQNQGKFPLSLMEKGTLETRDDKYLLLRWTDPNTKKLKSHYFKREDLEEEEAREIIEEKLKKLALRKNFSQEKLKAILRHYGLEAR